MKNVNFREEKLKNKLKVCKKRLYLLGSGKIFFYLKVIF